MKFMLFPATLALLMGWIAAPAQAAGCLERVPRWAEWRGIMPAITAFSAPARGASSVIMRRPSTLTKRSEQQQQSPSSDGQPGPNSGH